MTVPILDFASFDDRNDDAVNQLARRLDEALTTHGFVALTNIGLTPELRDKAFAIAQNFFEQPPALKSPYLYRDDQANFGYQPPLAESLDPKASGDLKETFT
ncbi:MAG: 2-oxoglutarate and iron-dependent oxygenase domain-containing protein, partial [Pseudomonadota bacterium]